MTPWLFLCFFKCTDKLSVWGLVLCLLQITRPIRCTTTSHVTTRTIPAIAPAHVWWPRISVRSSVSASRNVSFPSASAHRIQILFLSSFHTDTVLTKYSIYRDTLCIKTFFTSTYNAVWHTACICYSEKVLKNLNSMWTNKGLWPVGLKTLYYSQTKYYFRLVRY